MCGPAHSTQDQHAIERIIQGPREMPRNTNEDSAIASFPDPHLRLRLAVLNGRSEHSCPLEVSREGPITLVHKLRSEEHTSELQSRLHLGCRLLPEKKKKRTHRSIRSRRQPLAITTL